jgi:hypothetical protein
MFAYFSPMFIHPENIDLLKQIRNQHKSLKGCENVSSMDMEVLVYNCALALEEGDMATVHCRLGMLSKSVIQLEVGGKMVKDKHV